MTTATGSSSKTTHPLAAPEPAAAVRPSAIPRPSVRVRSAGSPTISFPADSPYVLRFWTQAIGPGPTEEFLRLSTAGRRRRPVLRPKFLATLISEGIVEVRDGVIYAPHPIPALPRHLAARLPRPERLVEDRWLTLARRRLQTAARRAS